MESAALEVGGACDSRGQATLDGFFWPGMSAAITILKVSSSAGPLPAVAGMIATVCTSKPPLDPVTNALRLRSCLG